MCPDWEKPWRPISLPIGATTVPHPVTVKAQRRTNSGWQDCEEHSGILIAAGQTRLFELSCSVPDQRDPKTDDLRIRVWDVEVDARVEELRAGYARVTMRDRPAVRNHLRCVHAIALLNLAELTGNAALAYSMPDDARFIVAGMSIEYLKKARGTITGVCECPIVETNERHEYQVPVSLQNEKGEVVATVTLRTLVGPKKA